MGWKTGLGLGLFLVVLCAGEYSSDFCWEVLGKGQLNANCLTIYVSKLLGWSIVTGAAVVKLPQIIKIMASGSVKGISLSSFLIEMLNFSLLMAYCVHRQLPFSTYGETALISFQCVLQCVLYWVYAKTPVLQVLLFSLFFVFGWCFPLFGEVLSEALWAVVPVLTNLMTIMTKLPQIYTIHLNKTTGQLSFVTNFMNLAGTAARIFTTLMEVNDVLYLLNHIAATILNLTLVLQFALYWRTEEKDKEN